MDVDALAQLSLTAALAGERVVVELPVTWERPHGFPFPTIRPTVPDPDGFGVWEWQPCAIILWVTTTRANEKTS